MATGNQYAGLLNYRFIILMIVVLAAITFLLGFYTTSAGQRAALASLIRQGKALATVLVSSADNIIKADRLITESAIDKIAAEFKLLAERPGSDRQFIDNVRARLGLIRIALLDEKMNTVRLRDEVSSSISDELDSLQQSFLATVRLDEPYSIAYEIRNIGDSRFLFALMPSGYNRHCLIVKPWNEGTRGETSLSLPYLLNQLSSQAGVEYIVLQNYEGIVFASKTISRMDRIKDDPFLTSAFEADTAISRILPFEDRQVLEIVRRFDSDERFQGLFRVGLSLYGYRQLALSLKRQVWFSLMLLSILVVLGMAFVLGRQALSLAKHRLDRAAAISSSLHDSIAGIVISVDSRLAITTANARARELFGIPSSGTENADSYSRLFPNDPFRIAQVIKTGIQSSFETHFEINDKTITMFASTSPIVDGDGRIVGAITVAQDISEKQDRERQAEHSRRLMELGSLAAGLAHDIRNPLNAIGLAIQRMKKEIQIEKGEAEFEEFMTAMEKQQGELSQLVEKILTIARASSLNKKMTNLKTALGDIIVIYANEAADRNIRIINEVEDVELPLDLPSFQSLISNLIKNAFEAINRDGTVKIKSEIIQGAGGLPAVRISIEDDGPGMDAEQLKSIFKPFYTTKPGGTGIGLAAAYKIAVDHGGDLKAYSKLGGPTTFVLTLPI